MIIIQAPFLVDKILELIIFLVVSIKGGPEIISDELNKFSKTLFSIQLLLTCHQLRTDHELEHSF